MHQVDLEAFVSSVCVGGSDHRKITCETLVDEPSIPPYYSNNSAVSPNDFPPESYYLSKDADQLEWLSDNAFFDRKDSQRGNSGILSSNPHSNPSSKRFLLKSKASLIGLPKPQTTCFNEVKQRRHGGKNRVILRRVGSRTKTDTSLLEPSSPKVSCIGTVRSRRHRSRRMQRQKSSRVEPANNRVKKSGFMASFRAIFRIKGGCKDTSARGSQGASSRKHDIRNRLPAEAAEKVSSSSSGDGGEQVVPGLGGMTRFASGRRREDLLDGGGC
ncbi:hypothetical protein CARUB_v10023842mg [Capsella rubella]|uniref:Uncharacterized protein n=1 Tax=Capsella rubella TaxID=81985 RepID=R0HDS0_9BRAS|nr:uncharacterized protein LOC17889229 [Capsella rubella]EOA27689.1 hypothetical protein CARUB_v10023842mg [Capsella rubella]